MRRCRVLARARYDGVNSTSSRRAYIDEDRSTIVIVAESETGLLS